MVIKDNEIQGKIKVLIHRATTTDNITTNNK